MKNKITPEDELASLLAEDPDFRDPEEDLPPPVEEYTPTQRSARRFGQPGPVINNPDDVIKARRESNPRSQAERQIIGDYVGTGHAIRVETPEWKPAEVNHCRYCGVDLPTPHEETPCEYTDGPNQPDPRVGRRYGRLDIFSWESDVRLRNPMPVKKRPDPTPDTCGCNGCVMRRGKLMRKAGRPREVCGAEECRKARQRERQREARARKKAQVSA